MMTTMTKRIAALLAALLMAAMPMTVFAVQGFETENCLVIATEPGGTSPYVEYYKNGELTGHEAMNWVDDGVRGKALALDGKTEYLQLGWSQLRMSQMTFSTWINFRGSADEANPNAALWQRLFTIQSGEQCYFTVSPHARDNTLTNEDGQLDGVYMEYFRGSEAENYSMKSFPGAIAGRSNFGLPQNEWHHMAIVVDNISVKMYVDGNLILEELFLMPIIQMSAKVMLIGGGMWGDPLLNALVDDMLFFDKALNAQEIAALMQTGDTAALKNPAAATTSKTAYEPTTVPTTTKTTVPTEQPADKPYAPFGLPVWGFGVCMGVLAFLILVTVIVNIYEIQRLKVKNVEIDDGDEEKPTMSIKQAAAQKRKEEYERFLTEEQMEQERRESEEGGANE